MTPTHPTRIGTHRRIADLMNRGLHDARSIAEMLGFSVAGIHNAIKKMHGLGYVEAFSASALRGGVAATMWRVIPGVVVPDDSGSPSLNPLREAAYVERVMAHLRVEPQTRPSLITATGMGSTQLQDVLTHLVDTGCVTAERKEGRGRPSFIYTLVCEPEDPASVTVRRYTHSKDEQDSGDDHDGNTMGAIGYHFEPSREVVACSPAKTTVTLASCIDGYVDATGSVPKSPRYASKCNGCRIGRARRADYAGFDFEESDDE